MRYTPLQRTAALVLVGAAVLQMLLPAFVRPGRRK